MKTIPALIVLAAACLLSSCVSSVLTAPIKVAGAAASAAVGVTKAVVTSND